MNRDKNRLIRLANNEDGCSIGVGGLLLKENIKMKRKNSVWAVYYQYPNEKYFPYFQIQLGTNRYMKHSPLAFFRTREEARKYKKNFYARYNSYKIMRITFDE